MNLALNNLQRLIGHKTQISNQPINTIKLVFLFCRLATLIEKCYVLTFDPAPKCYSKMMHRKEVTHSNGQ